MREVTGNFKGEGKRVGICVARFNEFITGRLLAGARDELIRHGVSDDNIDCIWVPGSFEIGTVAKAMTDKGYDGIICLGALIKGDTPHFDYISASLAKSISELGLKTGLPVIYGIVTAETLEQAIERAGAKSGNRGSDAAKACLEMMDLMTKI
ncbi:MAG: 6,7-dimethyl-8-ribityllumazine synthase [Elusimicrobiota bacterium]|nr:6,7-dimethyl-8-ribityllumazine synthase [Elusimicrobiota bacterium]